MNALATIQTNLDSLIGEDALRERLEKAGRPLRVKLGVDPTRPDLTFGHMVVFNKLRQFQDLGHQAILIIGDYTTLVGDPSGRSETRPVLSREEIEANSQTYLEQAFKILHRDRTTVRRNSEWFDPMGFDGALQLARQMTVARMLERDDFSKRYAANTPISIIEFLYPLLQGWDSVEIEADIELGGSDQLFNLLVGRDLQRNAGQPEQVVMTMPLLVGLDGVKKMSKSADNFIAFNDPPKEMFGKIMSISDDAMWEYFRLLLLRTDAAIEALKQEHPMEVKKRLAVELTSQLHGEGTGEAERTAFEQVFSKRELPDDMPELRWAEVAREENERLVNLIAAAGLVPSKKEGRRMVEQGAVKIDEVRQEDPAAFIARPRDSIVLQVGRRKFARIRA